MYKMPVEKIGRKVAKKLGADGVCYPTVPMLEQAIGHKGLCMACLNGIYPVARKYIKK